MDASFTLSPADRILGPREHRYEDVAVRGATLVLPDGNYPVTLTLQRAFTFRRRGRDRFEGWHVDWNAARGIPTTIGHDWKGNRVYGSSFTTSSPRPAAGGTTKPSTGWPPGCSRTAPATAAPRRQPASTMGPGSDGLG